MSADPPRLCLGCNADLAGTYALRLYCEPCVTRRAHRRKTARDRERRNARGLSDRAWRKDRLSLSGKFRCTRCRRTHLLADAREVECSTGAIVRVCVACSESRAPCRECCGLSDRRARPTCPACGEPYRERAPVELSADRGLGAWDGRAMP